MTNDFAEAILAYEAEIVRVTAALDAARAELALERDVAAQLRKDVESLATADVALRRKIADLRSIANVNGDWTLKVSEFVATINTTSALLVEAQRERDEARADLRNLRHDICLLIPVALSRELPVTADVLSNLKTRLDDLLSPLSYPGRAPVLDQDGTGR